MRAANHLPIVVIEEVPFCQLQEERRDQQREPCDACVNKNAHGQPCQPRKPRLLPSKCAVPEDVSTPASAWLCRRSHQRTHEQHVELVGYEVMLAGRRQQHEGKLPDLRHAEAHGQRCPQLVPEKEDHGADLRAPDSKHDDNSQTGQD